VKRIILFGAVLAAALMLGGFHQWSAHADPSGNESCSGSHTGDGTSWNYDNHLAGQWSMWTNWFCNTDKTFTWEFQKTTDGGATYYDYVGEFGHASQAGCSNGCAGWLHYPDPCVWTGSYRFRVNIDNQSINGPWVGAGHVCDGEQH
jgi:hypothetical protein